MRGRRLFLGALATTAACSGAAPTGLGEVKSEARIPVKAPEAEPLSAATIPAPATAGRCARQRPGSGPARLARGDAAPGLALAAPGVQVDPGDPRPSFGYGGSLDSPAENALVSVVDTTAERTLTRARGTDGAARRRECLLPRSATMGLGGSLLVSCLGIDAVLELDARAQNPAAIELRRFRLPEGPTGVAVDPDHRRAAVWSRFAHELSVIDLAAPLAPAKSASKPAPDALPTLRIAAARSPSAWVTAEDIVAAATISSAPSTAPPAPAARVAFPAGWVRGAKASLDAPWPTASLTLDPQRPVVAPETLRLADLPRIEVTPRPAYKQRPRSDVLTPGEPSRELFVTSGCERASVRNRAFGFISVGGGSLPIAPQSGGGVMLWGVKGDGHDRYTIANWQTLDRAPDGALRLQETTAWFDMITCKAYDAWSMEAFARPIAGGLAYAFRTHCATCKAADAEKLHLLTPDTGWGLGAFDHRGITLGPGTSSTSVIQLNNNAIRRFREGGAVTTRTADTALGLEIVQGIGETEPTAMFYVSDPPPSRF